MGGEEFGHLDEVAPMEPKKLLDVSKPQEQGAKVLPKDPEKLNKCKEDLKKIVDAAAQKCLSECLTEDQVIARVPDLETEIKKGILANELVRRSAVTMSFFWSRPDQKGNVHFKIMAVSGNVEIKLY